MPSRVVDPLLFLIETSTVSIGAVAVGFIMASASQGFSRYLRESGDWGNTWDEQLFQRTIPNAD